jgi:tetratricopeptide (TPR) repeat protein
MRVFLIIVFLCSTFAAKCVSQEKELDTVRECIYNDNLKEAYEKIVQLKKQYPDDKKVLHYFNLLEEKIRRKKIDWLRKIEMLKNENKYKEALDKVEKLLSLVPSDEEIVSIMKELYLLYETAESNKLNEEKMKSLLFDKHFTKGTKYYDEGNYIFAEMEFKKALSYEPWNQLVKDMINSINEEIDSEIERESKESTIFCTAQKYIYLGINYFRSGEFRKAYDNFLIVVRQVPYYKRVKIYIEELERMFAEEKNKKQAQCYYEAYKKMIKRNDLEGAYAMLSKACELDTENIIWQEEKKDIKQRMEIQAEIKKQIALAQDKINSNNLAEAIDIIIKVLSYDPNNKEVKDMVKNIISKLNNASPAVVGQQQSINLSSCIEKAKAAQNEGKYDVALQEWSKVLLFEPDNKIALEGIKFAYTKKIKSLQMRQEKEIAQKQKIAELSYVARKYFDAGDYRNALLYWEKVLQYDPQNTVAHNEKMRCEKMLNTKKPSQEVIDGYIRQGMELYMQGKYEEAINVWERVLLLDPTNEKVKINIEEAKSKLRGK